MFKNTLFLKIILVFTLPALGMLYFSTVLVYEKIGTLSEVDNIEHNIKYITATEKLVDSIQKERTYSVLYANKKEFINKLKNQRLDTNNIYENYLTTVSSLKKVDGHLIVNIKKVQQSFYELSFLREQVLNYDIKSLDILYKYSSINNMLLNTITSMKPIKMATEFNNKTSYLNNILSVKENFTIQNDIISILLLGNTFTEEIKKELIENNLKQYINIKQFLLKAEIVEIDEFNKVTNFSTENRILEIKNNLENILNSNELSLTTWLNLSNEKIDSLQKTYDYIKVEILKITKEIEEDAYLAQLLSLSFLFVSFVTLISLLFVLKNIIFNEQKSFLKVKKQKEIYQLLNKTNKFLLKTEDEKELFDKISKLISANSNMSFAFISLVTNTKEIKLIAEECPLKLILLEKLKEEKLRESIISESITLNKNIIINSFKEKNISVLSDVSDEYNIHSAAAFPIRKFDNIVAVLVLYSNEEEFFDDEIEILFDKMINDMSHSLEKIDYERTRLEQENNLRIASYAFESNEPMIITDKNIRIINTNQAFCNVMGYTKDYIIGKKPSIFKSSHQDQKFYSKLWEVLSKEGSWSGEIFNTKKNIKQIPLRSTITAIKDNKGNITHYLGQYIDISEQKSKVRALEYQATHDNLTGLPNRLLLLDRIERAISKIVRHKTVGGLIFIDLDNFKEVNDTLGHDIGDMLLRMVADKIKETVRKEDTIARIGGDEFIVLTDHIGKNKEEAIKNMTHLSNKIKLALNSIIEIDGHKNISTPSIGVTIFDDDTVSIKEIIKQADTAMYTAKRLGKNSIEFFDKNA
ncbi:diguanylate cyclase [Poseidonibacter sp.]|uniref:diguanylate cyclase n=1 Tax=Poseidonibacter sp. TaxID=2321188 RepID=UPI003C716D8C